MMTMALMVPYNIIVQGIYAGLIGTISTITMGSCFVIKSIYNNNHPDATKVMKELDLERKLSLIQAVINRIEKHSNKKMNDLEKTQIFDLIRTDINLSSDPIELSLIYLKESIQVVNSDLLFINKKMENHKAKWFSSWRKTNVKPLLDDLVCHSKILDSRFDDLTKISLFLARC